MFDKLIAGQIARGILWVLAALAAKYGIDVTDTSWVEGLSIAAAGAVLAAISLIWTRYRARALLMTDPPAEKPPLLNLTKTPPVVCLVLLLLPLAGGCAQSARHDFNLAQGKLQLDNATAIEELSIQADTSTKAKAAQDAKRLDDALMLEIEILAKKQFTDDTARQAAILALVQKYKTSVVEVNADIANVSERTRRIQELVAQIKEAAIGMLEVDAQNWANTASQQDLIHKAIVGNLLQLFTPKGTGAK